MAKRHTPLAKHKKVGSKLKGPMAELNFAPFDWVRDLLPEHLWIGSLALEFGLDRCHVPYREFLDALDAFYRGPHLLIGLISDFDHVPGERRAEFLEEHADLVEAAFVRPVGRLLAFYPECPAKWLLQPASIAAGGPLDPVFELGRLRQLFVKLFPGKDEFAGRVRALPLMRFLQHNKVQFLSTIEGVKLIPKYPIDCTRDEQCQVESLARQLVNMSVSNPKIRPDLADKTWPKHFWRHNHDLAVCTALHPRAGAASVSDEEAVHLQDVLRDNAGAARHYMKELSRKLVPDLYDPLQDEVLFGLFGRLTRLLCLLFEDPNLWARDVGGIFLRCMADTAISFAYLARRGTSGEFAAFKEHGEGQEKLLMLHLQDNHPESRSLEGLTSKDLSDELGDFPAELLDIELGHWTKKDTRRLAYEAGVEKLYRLVFSPASGDVHGMWMSLKRSNLVYCGEPLHRLHRLPSLVEPPFYVDIVNVAAELYESCRAIGAETRGYPAPVTALQQFVPAMTAPAPTSPHESTENNDD